MNARERSLMLARELPFEKVAPTPVYDPWPKPEPHHEVARDSIGVPPKPRGSQPVRARVSSLDQAAGRIDQSARPSLMRRSSEIKPPSQVGYTARGKAWNARPTTRVLVQPKPIRHY